MKFLPPPVFLKAYYEYYTGKKLNLENPVEFNEKIQWLKIYYHPPLLNKLVDKYEVREYVKQKIGDQYLNDLLNIYTGVNQVNFAELPSQFVLKATHGYNFNIVVRDKKKLNVSKAKLTMRKWLNRNQYYRGGLEWAYKNVPKRIIAEKYLAEIDNGEASDYKFFCFNGKPEYLLAVGGTKPRYSKHYDLNWKPLEFHRAKRKTCNPIPKPKNFEQMKELAGKLAGNFPFVRVDLYNLQGRILFGELTFYPADGRIPYTPDKYNRIIGDMLKLPQIPKGAEKITEI